MDLYLTGDFHLTGDFFLAISNRLKKNLPSSCNTLLSKVTHVVVVLLRDDQPNALSIETTPALVRYITIRVVLLPPPPKGVDDTALCELRSNQPQKGDQVCVWKAAKPKQRGEVGLACAAQCLGRSNYSELLQSFIRYLHYPVAGICPPASYSAVFAPVKPAGNI